MNSTDDPRRIREAYDSATIINDESICKQCGVNLVSKGHVLCGRCNGKIPRGAAVAGWKEKKGVKEKKET
jgi:hypothetical protein